MRVTRYIRSCIDVPFLTSIELLWSAVRSVYYMCKCLCLWALCLTPSQDRTNVLLLGDSTGDPHMADAFEAGHQLNIVKVGFLNYREEELLPQYLELYDIVLTGDTSMDVVNSIVVYILDQLVHSQ